MTSNSDLFLSRIFVRMSNYKESYTSGISQNHRFIYSMFDKIEHGRLLWLDNSNQRQKFFWVVSEVKPRLKDKYKSYVVLESRKINDRFFEHKSYAFKTLINCVVCRNKKRVPLFEHDEILAWFKQRLLKTDCVLNEDRCLISPPRALIFEHLSSDSRCNNNSNNAQTITLNVCEISGVLTAKNPQLLKELVRNGIGRSKSFGCGLMQLVPVSDN